MTLSRSESGFHVIGAGGHCRSVLGLVYSLDNMIVEGIYDDSYVEGEEELILGIPLRGKLSKVPESGNILLAVGNNSYRKELFRQYEGRVYPDNLFHRTSFSDEYAVYGNSNILLGGAFVNAAAVIGDNNLLNTHCVVEHEVRLGNHNHVSVGAVLCGRVKIGDEVFIGANSVVREKVRICSGVTIGAGSVVVRDIEESGIYLGNPAKRLMK